MILGEYPAIHYEGKIGLEGRYTRITDEDGSVEPVIYNIFNLLTTCKAVEPCTAELFVLLQS